ncbi:hypothetical protein MUK42_02047 [Musa troglodytarum]|uniref:Uncharacterized protein n=1 Tax=Musa troglodytarum TaxID=320322 RepID=A0A9E7JH98_9LILI|nr:hypothetical protein MUK42_02047 [Musa troglodytarum]
MSSARQKRTQQNKIICEREREREKNFHFVTSQGRNPCFTWARTQSCVLERSLNKEET